MSIQHILPELPLEDLDVIFVENIGNLVCPAEFRIGESLRITILSIPEGDDKVEKYPLMFTDTDCLALNKYDMLPYFDFDEERVLANYRDRQSRRTPLPDQQPHGDGIEELAGFIAEQIRKSTVMNQIHGEAAIRQIHIEIEGIVQGWASAHSSTGWQTGTGSPAGCATPPPGWRACYRELPGISKRSRQSFRMTLRPWRRSKPSGVQTFRPLPFDRFTIGIAISGRAPHWFPRTRPCAGM